MARVFLSGGSGFIGGALCEQLVERADEVVALARSDTAEEVVAGHGVVRGPMTVGRGSEIPDPSSTGTSI